MTYPAASVLQHSDLNPFLFADVGTELNGSPLTVLSIFARLDRDPWIEAARLADLSRPEALARLARAIEKMPLAPRPVADMAAMASRLILLLPARAGNPRYGSVPGAVIPPMPQWVPVILLCASLIFGIVLNMVAVPSPGRPEAVSASPPVAASAMK